MNDILDFLFVIYWIGRHLGMGVLTLNIGLQTNLNRQKV